MRVIKGFNKLSSIQQELFNRVYERHMDAVEDKSEWVPKSVSCKARELKVSFTNGTWLHYTTYGEWY